MNNNETVLLALSKLYEKLKAGEILGDRTEQQVVEIINFNTSLDPAQPVINLQNVRKTPIKYAKKEIEWYDSCDLSVDNISKHASMWKEVASKSGTVNSNYGWCIYSDENQNQYHHALEELKSNKNSRRSVMIYNRPSMQIEWNKDGMNDFICTFSTQHFVRNNKLEYIVYMRSNDAIFGFFNDFYWHCEVYKRMFNDLKQTYSNLEYGNIHWNSGSFHLYERHFDILKKLFEDQSEKIKL